MTFRKSMWNAAVSKPFARYAWFLVGYTIFVILWGAFVRATGSGAGCGSHWPTCNGTVVPRPERVETLIEFSHRITSGLLGLLSLVQLIWAMRVFPKGHRVRKGSLTAFIFVLIEGALGAGLVLFELVAGDTSSARAVVVGLHLVNTLLLLGAFTLTAWWASGGEPLRPRERPGLAQALGVALFGLLIVAAFGAITALGDTLFPAGSLAEGVAQDFNPESHFAVRLRVWHPVIAILTSLYLVLLIRIVEDLRRTPLLNRLARLNVALVGLQVLLGFANVLLLAPVWMQIVHLLVADLMWVALLTFTAAALAPEQGEMYTQEMAKAFYSANGRTAKSAEPSTHTRK